jgi:uncharacterized protein (DUF362 family)
MAGLKVAVRKGDKMTDFGDKMVGVYHFLADRAPGDIPLVDPKPLPANQWLRDSQALVAKVKAGGNIKADIQKAITLLGSLEQVIDRGDRVLLKPNFNSQDPYPGSTDLPFLRAVVELLLEAGAKVTIGESSGGIWRPTRNVFKKVGVYELAGDLGVELIAFDDRPDDWVRVKVNGDYLSSVTMPRSAYETDKIVYLPCLKTHGLARFSGALKLVVGFVHPGERRAFHARHLEQKIAEISLCWQPNLIIMDGRKAFISGGPDRGQLVEPELVLASGDLVAIDVEAIKVILSYKASNKLMLNPWELPQVVAALKHGLGMGQNSYIVVD